MSISHLLAHYISVNNDQGRDTRKPGGWGRSAPPTWLQGLRLPRLPLLSQCVGRELDQRGRQHSLPGTAGRDAAGPKQPLNPLLHLILNLFIFYLRGGGEGGERPHLVAKT